MNETNKRSTIQEQESRLGKLSKCLPKAENSIIPHRIILKYQSAYQAHLERIADFPLCGEGVWWRHVVSGVEFFDVTTPSEAQNGADILPPLHHFRSHTLKSEVKYLQDAWKECVASDEVKIPHQAIRVFDDKGNLDQIIYTGFLDDDNDDDDDDDGSDAECNSNENFEGRSEHHANTESSLVDHESEDNEDETDDEEENVVAIVDEGEHLLHKENLTEGLEVQVEEDTRATPTSGVHETCKDISEHNPSTPSLSSTLARNVAKILGETEDVKQLDRSRNKLRNNLNNKALQEEYERQLAHVQTKVIAKHSQLTKTFKEWEKIYTSRNNWLEPTVADIEKDDKGYKLYKTLRLCRQFLKHWNITAHLYNQ